MDQTPQGPGASFQQVAEGMGVPSPPKGINQGQHPQAAGTTVVHVPKTHTFQIKHTSEFSGVYYEGQFSVRKLSILDIGRISVRKTQLNGGYHFDSDNPGCGIDEETDTIHNMISHLEIALIQWPTWWKLAEIDDPDLLRIVFNHCVTFENSFLSRRGVSRPGGGVPDDSGSKGEESRNPGHVEEVGGGQVQNTLDP